MPSIKADLYVSIADSLTIDSKNFLASGSVTSLSSVVNVFLSVLNPPAEASDTLGDMFNPPLSGKLS